MKTRIAMATVVAVACAIFVTDVAQAQGNLFPQYYTQGGASRTTAAAYLAPHYVPREMGHTYYTYQPLMPHEMMYQHSRNYYNYYGSSQDFYSGCQGGDGCYGGNQSGSRAVTVTKVRWQAGTNHMFHLPGGHQLPSLGGLCKKLSSKCAGGKCHGGKCGGASRGGDYCGGEGYVGETYDSGCANGNCSAQLPVLTIER